MSRQTFTLNDHVLEITREQVEVTSMLPQRDPKWRATDDAGHQHYAVDIGTGVSYPTIAVRHSEPEWCDDCRDDHTDAWFVCDQCGQKITPGTYIDRSRKFVPGLTSYALDGESVSPETASAFIESWQRQADDRSSRRAQADREAGYL